MNFRERRISEYKTAPDVRRHGKSSSGADKHSSRRSSLARAQSKSTLSGIPVLERKKMFEQTDSPFQTAAATTGPSHSSSGASFGAASGKRASKQRKDMGRNSSFRGTKRLKTEDGHSPVLGRAKHIGSLQNASLPTWKKLRNFGHFDLQSLGLNSFHPSHSDQAEQHNVKRPTGASAAHGAGGGAEGGAGGVGGSSGGGGSSTDGVDKSRLSNCLVACCPAFTNEIGGDSDWLGRENPLLPLRDTLSIEKQRRVGSRERIIVDGDLPLKGILHRGPMNRQVSDVLFPKSGINYPFEFIDFGASYYRNYFLQYGE